jgi:integrase
VVEPSRQPLRDWFGEWLTTRAATVRPSTVRAYRIAFDVLDDELGGVPLAQLTPSRIERAYAAAGQRFAPSTIRGSHRVLSQVLKTAVRDRLIARNPLEAVAAPGDTSSRRGAWTITQARTFLSGAVGHVHEDAWHVFLECWLRSGELRALRWGDIDLANGTLTVARSVTGDEKGRPRIGETKNASSRRTLTISPRLAARLQDRLHGDRLTAQLEGVDWSADRLVFPNRAGGLMTSGTLCDALKRLCAKLDLPYYGIHGLRHAGGSIAHANGVPIAIISERMGHANPQITWQVYTHADQSQHQQVADLLGTLLGSPEGFDAE